MVGQGLGQGHITAGIEALDQLEALVFEIALHRVAAAGQRILVVLGVIAEPGVQFRLAPVGQVSESTGQLQSVIR